MIALNELVKFIDKYKEAYKLMGLKINLNSFIGLENKLREAGLAFEHARSTCNKKCGELIKKQANNLSTDVELEEIKKLDKQTLKLQANYNKINKRINKKLDKLPNIPDEKNVSNLQIDTLKKHSTINNLKDFIEKTFKPYSFDKTVNKFEKAEADKLFEEDNLPQITYCKNGIVIFCLKDNVENLLSLFLTYFKENSISMIKHSIKNLNRSSSQEYLIHLNNKLYLKLELKREFVSRKFKIKYHDNKTDMTKFVNQINILF